VIYDHPVSGAAIDQGDLFENCPILAIKTFHAESGAPEEIEFGARRVVVLTQTCDFANEKISAANVAEVHDAQSLVDQGYFKPSDVRGPIRGGRIWGWYYLPADANVGLPEMIVDLRRLHTIRLDLLRSLCQAGQRRARMQPLYREHLAKHFADTFSRIGLPRPYETM
jgi:hypothetical protein